MIGFALAWLVIGVLVMIAFLHLAGDTADSNGEIGLLILIWPATVGLIACVLMSKWRVLERTKPFLLVLNPLYCIGAAARAIFNVSPIKASIRYITDEDLRRIGIKS